MATLTVIQRHDVTLDIGITTQAHTFMTLVVSFLLVSRVNIGLDRYNQARDCLGVMYCHCRELIQNACIFTANSKSNEAQEWRHELAYRCLLLLRLSMAVVDYPTDKVAAWNVPELKGAEKLEIQESIFFEGGGKKRWGDKKLSEWEESLRVPIRMAYLLRKTIHAQKHYLDEPMALSTEDRMHTSVDSYMGGYYGIRKFISTPLSFPLVQMSRTFCFLYVFTLPLVMLDDKSGSLAHCVAIFLITYGFLGLELTAIELDNPFGDDDNDFDNRSVDCGIEKHISNFLFPFCPLLTLLTDTTQYTVRLRARPTRTPI